MSDFFLPTLFVVAEPNTLPITGSTSDLTPQQFGFFDQNYAPVTAGNAAAASYLYGAQGRIEVIPGLGSKRTDRIYKKNILQYYKVPAVPVNLNQITTVSAIHAQCEQDLVLTVRLFSSYIETGFFNGKTTSFTMKGGCCACGGDICADVNAEAVVDYFVAAVNADKFVGKYIVASKTGTGATASLVLTGLILDKYGNPCSPTAFSYEYDKLRFDTFAYKNPDTTQDYIVADSCDIFATVTKTQTSTYPRGGGDEIFEMEKRYQGYHTYFKSIFRNIEYDGAFTRYSLPATFYDMLFIRMLDPDNLAWELSEQYDQMIMIAAPTGGAAETAIEAILTAFVGNGPEVIAQVP